MNGYFESMLDKHYQSLESEDNPGYEPAADFDLEAFFFGPDTPTEIIPVAVFDFGDIPDSDEFNEVA